MGKEEEVRIKACNKFLRVYGLMEKAWEEFREVALGGTLDTLPIKAQELLTSYPFQMEMALGMPLAIPFINSKGGFKEMLIDIPKEEEKKDG